MSDCRTVPMSDCRTVPMSDCRTVPMSDCRTVPVSDSLTLVLSECPTLGLSDTPTVPSPNVHQITQLSQRWTVQRGDVCCKVHFGFRAVVSSRAAGGPGLMHLMDDDGPVLRKKGGGEPSVDVGTWLDISTCRRAVSSLLPSRARPRYNQWEACE
jgi:hypothetical protein